MPCRVVITKPRTELEWAVELGCDEREARRRITERHIKHGIAPADDPGGAVMFVCGRVAPDMMCALCPSFSDVLCDGPVGRGRTCDIPLCADCAKRIADDVDLCPVHYAEHLARISR